MMNSLSNDGQSYFLKNMRIDVLKYTIVISVLNINFGTQHPLEIRLHKLENISNLCSKIKSWNTYILSNTRVDSNEISKISTD